MLTQHTGEFNCETSERNERCLQLGSSIGSASNGFEQHAAIVLRFSKSIRYACLGPAYTFISKAALTCSASFVTATSTTDTRSVASSPPSSPPVQNESATGLSGAGWCPLDLSRLYVSEHCHMALFELLPFPTASSSPNRLETRIVGNLSKISSNSY
jgi:hypothetical protein